MTARPSSPLSRLLLSAALALPALAADDTGLSSLPPPPAPSPVADILAAEPAVTPHADPLPLERAVAQALAANFDVQLQRIALDNSADAIEIARAGYDPTLTIAASTAASIRTHCSAKRNTGRVAAIAITTTTNIGSV